MNEQETREKIIKIIAPYVSAYGDDERIANALIAVGIGDVESLEISDADKEQSSVNYYCEMREWKDKCKEAEHRAEVTERILKTTEKLADEAVKIMKERVKKLKAENATLREKLRKAMSCPRRFDVVFKGDDND